MNIFDSHTHLNQEDLFPNREQYIKEFINIGGKGIVNAGANRIYNKNGIIISDTCKKKYPNLFVKCALGWHPCDVENIGENYEAAKDELKEQIINNKEYIVAIGECGIDLHYDTEGRTLNLQKEYFNSQCKLAQELDFPIMIHSRDAFYETYDILKNYTNLTVYIHCRGYGPKELTLMLKTSKNLYIGFCGNITYKNAENLRESIRILPIEKLLIETDAPYLSPQGFRGTLNTPIRVKDIGSYISNLLNIEEKTLRKQIEENFFNLYSK